MENGDQAGAPEKIDQRLQEDAMAKGQMRSNKEKKKPKATQNLKKKGGPPPSPFAPYCERPARQLAHHPSPPVMRKRAEPATRHLEMNGRHLNSPNVVERCEYAHHNHLFIKLGPMSKSTNETFSATA